MKNRYDAITASIMLALWKREEPKVEKRIFTTDELGPGYTLDCCFLFASAEGV